MIGFKANMVGWKELEAALKSLPDGARKSTLEAAGKKALVPVAAAAARLAPRSDEHKPHLADSITVGTQLTKRQRRARGKQGEAVVYAGARVPHAHLVEFGTGPRQNKKTGKFSGQMPAQPFMRPAWDSHKGEVLSIFRKEIWIELKKTARRLRRKAERNLKRIFK